ncbi:hypothetical protein Tco_0996931 [Tanacetum coccineum]
MKQEKRRLREKTWTKDAASFVPKALNQERKRSRVNLEVRFGKSDGVSEELKMVYFTGSLKSKSKKQSVQSMRIEDLYQPMGMRGDWFKIESRDVKRAPEVMRISGFMHGITNQELIKRLHDKIPKSVDEMWKITTTFLRGEVEASNQERKKTFLPLKAKRCRKPTLFQNMRLKDLKQRPEKRQDIFALLTKTPKEILALDKGKFKPPPPMTTPVEKRNASKFCEFHGEVGHITDECMHLKWQIKEIALRPESCRNLIKGVEAKQ